MKKLYLFRSELKRVIQQNYGSVRKCAEAAKIKSHASLNAALNGATGFSPDLLDALFTLFDSDNLHQDANSLRLCYLRDFVAETGGDFDDFQIGLNNGSQDMRFEVPSQTYEALRILGRISLRTPSMNDLFRSLIRSTAEGNMIQITADELRAAGIPEMEVQRIEAEQIKHGSLAAEPE